MNRTRPRKPQNNETNAARQARLRAKGYRSTTVYLSAAAGETISAFADNLIERGLLTDCAMPEPSTIIRQNEPDLFGSPEPTFTRKNEVDPALIVGSDRGKAELMTAIGAMVDAGLSGAEIARRLNADGYRTVKGAEFNGANVLRDWRRWQECGSGV